MTMEKKHGTPRAEGDVVGRGGEPSGAPGGKDRDAQLRFSGTRDRMKVGVAKYDQPRGAGRPLSLESIREQLREAGVTVPMCSKGAEELLRRIAAGESFERVVIARGILPRGGTDAYVLPCGNLSYPVFPGDVFGKLIPAVQPAAGMRVDGQELPPPSGQRPRSIAVEEHGGCMQHAASGELVSRIYGLVQITDTSVLVEPLLHVSADHLEIEGTVYAQDAAGVPITVERMLALLRNMGIAPDCVERSAIAERLAHRGEGEEAGAFTLARGRAPVPGRDGYVELVIPHDIASNVGKATVSGGVDFRDRGVIPAVRAGQTVAIVHPPAEGESGCDVYGQDIAAQAGAPAHVVLDGSVAMAEDGVHVVAGMDGLCQYVTGVLSVQEVMRVAGNVDYATGNILAASGSVHVAGTVLSGFSVKAPGSVLVAEVVESATIVAGGNIDVRGGLVMKGQCSVRSGGSVFLGYANEACVEARENVVVRDYLLHSTVLCGGRVLVGGGRGKIQGGAITCRGGVEAVEVGNELGVVTAVTVTAESKQLRELEKDRDSMRDALHKIATRFGEASDEDILINARPDQYKAVETALMLRTTLTERMEGVRMQIAEERDRVMAQLADARVRVSGVVYPGVVVTMGEAIFSVSQALRGTTFRYDPARKTIDLTTL